MSGGALNYASHRLDDPIKDIEQRIRVNGKTVQQIWDEKTDEEKESAREWGHDWEIPWTEKNVPDSVRSIAQDEAWKKCKGKKIERYYDGWDGSENATIRSLPTKKARDEWWKIYSDTLKEMIESHNNGIEREIYSPEVITEMKKQLETIKRARIYLERIEWLLSEDDGQENYLERTKEDLKDAGI